MRQNRIHSFERQGQFLNASVALGIAASKWREKTEINEEDERAESDEELVRWRRADKQATEALLVRLRAWCGRAGFYAWSDDLIQGE
ncbi:MAG: hypothetical protein ACLRSW_15295 [Christensenellaceae bacterium]